VHCWLYVIAALQTIDPALGQTTLQQIQSSALACPDMPLSLSTT